MWMSSLKIMLLFKFSLQVQVAVAGKCFPAASHPLFQLKMSIVHASQALSGGVTQLAQTLEREREREVLLLSFYFLVLICLPRWDCRKQEGSEWTICCDKSHRRNETFIAAQHRLFLPNLKVFKRQPAVLCFSWSVAGAEVQILGNMRLQVFVIPHQDAQVSWCVLDEVFHSGVFGSCVLDSGIS